MLSILHRSSFLLKAKLSCTLLTANIAKGKTSKLQPRTSNKLAKGEKMPRYWDTMKPEKQVQSSTTNDTSKRYKLLSYNILAQDLLIEHLHLYLQVDPDLLKWEFRLQNLRAEILALAPDILCLQEMQFNHLENLVKLIQGKRQLQFVFKKKTGHRTDGCAIIYDKDKFTLLEERAIEYYTPDEPLLNRDNVALLAKFHPCEDPTKVFIVATTHLLYNPRRDDVRTAQVQVLLKALATFSVRKEGEALPVLLTGDFNCMPFSPPYHALLTATKVPTLKSNSSQNQSEEKQNEDMTCTTSNDVNENTQELQMMPIDFGRSTASTFQERWITVDYILQSIGAQRETIKVWSVYNLPTVRECHSVGPIPNKHLGSDHYSLAITFSV